MTGYAMPAGRQALIVDRWPLARWAVAELLRGARLFESVAVAYSAEGAWRMCQSRRPDLVVTDCDLRNSGDGLQLGRRLRGLPFPRQVLVYAERDAADVIIECLKGAAHSFVHRSVETLVLMDAVERLLAGRPVWLTGHQPPALRKWPTDGPQTDGMTVREQEVLGLLLRRYSNDGIARELHLAKQTVKDYVSTVLQKLDVPSRRELYGRVWLPTAQTLAPAR